MARRTPQQRVQDRAVPTFKAAKKIFERYYITSLLRHCRGNMTLGARLAQKDRKDLYELARRAGVTPKDFRS